jgi:exopolysaccharide biosynthesis polyprenyl glycosylphosphotransferase
MTKYHAGLPAWNDARPIFYRLLIILGDAAVIFLCYASAYFIRFHNQEFIRLFPIVKGVPSPELYWVVWPLVACFWILALSWQGAYNRINMPALDEAIRIIRGSFLGTLLAMSTLFLYRESSFSRVVFLLGGVISCIGIYIWREILKISYVTYVRAFGRPRRVLIVGEGYLANSLRKILRRQGDRAVLRRPACSIDILKRTLVRSRIGELLIAYPEFDHKDAVKLADVCEERNVSFRILPDLLEIRMGEVLVDESFGIPMIQLKSISLHGTAFLAKRFVDVALASFVLGVLFVPLFFLSLLIKATSPGPLFYKHKRMGFKGREFDFYKFRTMVQDADALLEDLKSQSDRAGGAFKMKNDPRITIIGRFLRRLSLDELPQLINVLRGEMSLVGPRPQVLWETQQYDEWARKRLNVLPGITGLWQVSGRAELTYQEMIDLDIYYIEHWSPGLDIKIILKTLPAVLFAKGAY